MYTLTQPIAPTPPVSPPEDEAVPAILAIRGVCVVAFVVVAAAAVQGIFAATPTERTVRARNWPFHAKPKPEALVGIKGVAAT